MFGGISVLCLSVCLSVLFHCRQRLQFFGTIFAPPNSSGTRTVSVEIWAKILWIVQVKYKAYEKGAFFDQYLALFRKWYNIGPWFTMEDE